MMSFPKVEGYVVVEKLGSGSYSTVYKAYAKVGPRAVLAIKCVDKCRLKNSESGVDNLITEIRLLKTLRHPHIVHMHEFTWTDKHILIVMEYCMGDLSRYIRRCGRLPEMRVLFFLQQLASALQFLRSKGVAHMDLKPHNLLLSKGSEGKYILKVADFGFAQYMSADTIKCSIRGSPLYMAPEMLTEDNPTYDASVDLWSVGVIMYECLFGKAPYSSTTFKELMDKIVNRHPIEFPSSVPVSDGCADLLTRLLQHDPAARITHEDFFSHRYLDLEHMPSPENYEKAVSMIKRAVEADSKKHMAEAFDLYCESLRYLVPVVNSETDSVRRSALRAKVTQYMQRAEELKTVLSAIRQMDCNVPSMEESGRCAATASATPARRRGDRDRKPVPPKKTNCFCNCTNVQVSTSDSVKFTSRCSCGQNDNHSAVNGQSDSDRNNSVNGQSRSCRNDNAHAMGSGHRMVGGQNDNGHAAGRGQNDNGHATGRGQNENGHAMVRGQNDNGHATGRGQNDNGHATGRGQNDNGHAMVRGQSMISGQNDNSHAMVSGHVIVHGQNDNGHATVCGQNDNGHAIVRRHGMISGQNDNGHAMVRGQNDNGHATGRGQNDISHRQKSVKGKIEADDTKNKTEAIGGRAECEEGRGVGESGAEGRSERRWSETENIPRLQDESDIVEETVTVDKPKKIIFGDSQDVCSVQ